MIFLHKKSPFFFSFGDWQPCDTSCFPCKCDCQCCMNSYIFYHPLDMSDSKVSHAHQSKGYKEGKL